MNDGQKTSLFHSDREHSIGIPSLLSSLKTNQLYQRMTFQPAYQLNNNNNNDFIYWQRERMKDTKYGVNAYEINFTFGDNESEVMSGTVPHAKKSH